MQAQPIRDVYRPRPFQPSGIRTESGGSYPVDHPEHMGWTVDRAPVLLSTWSERVALIEVASITAISHDSNTQDAS
jgi:hypothetical protein